MKICRCNKCGRIFDEFDYQQPHSLAGFMLYGSEHDGQWLELDLCAICLDRLISSCVINPIVDEEGHGKQHDI